MTRAFVKNEDPEGSHAVSSDATVLRTAMRQAIEREGTFADTILLPETLEDADLWSIVFGWTSGRP